MDFDFVASLDCFSEGQPDPLKNGMQNAFDTNCGVLVPTSAIATFTAIALSWKGFDNKYEHEQLLIPGDVSLVFLIQFVFFSRYLFDIPLVHVTMSLN